MTWAVVDRLMTMMISDQVHNQSFQIADKVEFINRMLSWADQFGIFVFMDGQDFDEARSFPTILAAGVKRGFIPTSADPLRELQEFHEQSPAWLFGHLAFDCSGVAGEVFSKREPFVRFPSLFFFEPEVLIKVEGDMVHFICAADSSIVFDQILNFPTDRELIKERIELQNRISKQDYISTLHQLKVHLQEGDCYEINYCQEFYSESANIDPLTTYLELMRISSAPFSALYKYHQKYCICASPERFILKKDRKLISQPMKGTKQRSSDATEDEKNKIQLEKSEKDRSENIMIVDLVRNDLSRFCVPGSVKVEELCAVHSYPNVHQMISTVSGDLYDKSKWTEVLRNCFPMGSMTGAPKKRVLELTEKYEAMARGLYSGSIGYVDPDSEMDFNVVIRSIFYDRENKRLSFCAGGGITIGSDPETEYEESLLKARAIRNVLERG